MSNIITAALMMPFWYLSYLFNRNKKKIIFGSWYGEKYADNPRYLFEFFSSFNDYESYWITRNKTIYKRLKSQNKKVLLVNSISGIYHSLTAGVIIFSSGKKDVNPYFINGAIIINLWHGAPLKKICKLNDKVNSELINKLKGFFLPNIYEYNIDYVLSTSKVFDQILSKSFGVNSKNILKFGYPRNDSFFLEKEITATTRKICYLPTFRDGIPDYDLFESFGFDLKTTEEFLRNNNCEMYLGSHFVSKKYDQ
ncbi:CDP-glycerol glycerophosphotransferase family protein, partial [Flavobacteriaceae bacterium]|nr:CDP-glycerol glycerophosphotransferase family protein [Flavobacteriaceae bacterium]